ncbi:hypothetical protein JCM3765_002006 [Sporobolomyces pararoseus]
MSDSFRSRMFTYVYDKDNSRWAECNFCDAITKVGTSEHATTGKYTGVRHFETCHVPEKSKWKCTECQVAFVARKSSTGYGHPGDCPEREGREAEKELKPWLREWDSQTKTFTTVRELNAKLPYDLRPDKPSSEKKGEFEPIARKREPPNSNRTPTPKRGRGYSRGRGRGRRRHARKSSSESLEDFQTSSEEDSPPFSAAATSSEDSDESEESSTEDPHRRRKLVVKLKLPKERLNAIQDAEASHLSSDAATDSDSQYEVPKTKKGRHTHRSAITSARSATSAHRARTTSSPNSLLLDRGSSPLPPSSPNRSRSPTPLKTPSSEGEAGFFDEAFAPLDHEQ